MDYSKRSHYRRLNRYIYRNIRVFETGQKLWGQIRAAEGDYFSVDVGWKDYAMLLFAEVGSPLQVEVLRKNASIYREFMVTDVLQDGFHVKLSIKAIQVGKCWDRAFRLLKTEGIEELDVVEILEKGYRLQLGELISFLPKSLVHPINQTEFKIGDVIPVQIIEIEQSTNRIIASNRAAVWSELGVNYDFETLKSGDIVEGYVKNVTKFGAFIDLGNHTGLLHISQVTNKRITSLNGVFQLGEKIKSMVLTVDRELDRISLTTKKIEPLPGLMLSNRREVMLQADEMAKIYRTRLSAVERALTN